VWNLLIETKKEYIMEKKKEYTEPDMKVVNLASQVQPLCGSCEGENCGPFGLAPHEQDPIA